MLFVFPQHQWLIDVGLQRPTEWSASAGSRRLYYKRVHWISPAPSLRKPDLVRRFSSLFISDLIAYPAAAMAEVEAGKRDRLRDAMFFACDKFLALLDFFIGLAYEVLDLWHSGWCDELGKPLTAASGSGSPSFPPSLLRSQNGSSMGGSVVVDSSDMRLKVGPAVKKDLANFFYRPRKRGLKMTWDLTDVNVVGVTESSRVRGATCRNHKGGQPRRRPIARSREKCTCWGWHLDELLADSSSAYSEGAGDQHPAAGFQPHIVRSLVQQIVLAEHKKSGWSECQCEECVSALMPSELALGRLYVRTAETEANNSNNKLGSLWLRPSSERSAEGSSEDSDDDGREFVSSTDDNSDSSSDSESSNGMKPAFDMYSLAFGPIGLVGGNLLDQTRLVNAGFMFSPDPGSFDKPRSAVIFIHGIYSSSTFWFETVIPHLSPDITSEHQVLVPDLLGCGKSPRPVDSLYTLEEQVESIRRSVLERHDIHSFHIVSHSMGTVVALALAGRFADRVRSLTLIAPLYGGTGEADLVDPQLPTCDAVMALTKPWTLKGMKAIAGKDYYNVSRLIAHVLFTKHDFWVPLMHRHLKRYPISFIEGYFRNSHHATWHMSHNTLLSGTHSMASSLAKLRQKGKPVLVMHGDVDTTCFYRQSVEMSRHFNNVRLVTVPGKGHVDVIFGNETKILQEVEKEILRGDAEWSLHMRGRTGFKQKNGARGLRTP